MNKRGLSAVITTLLVIMLVLVAAGIVWGVIRKIITEGSEEVNLGKLTLDLEVENVLVDENGVNVKVTRKSGAGELSGINFAISDGENTIVLERPSTMAQLGSGTFPFTNEELSGIAFVKEVTIVPILGTGSGKKIFGSNVDEVENSVESCLDILNLGGSMDGIYSIKPKGEEFEVYCDLTTDGGGWTLIASYVDGSFFNDCDDILEYNHVCSSTCSNFADDSHSNRNCDEDSERAIQDSELEKLKEKYKISGSFRDLSSYETHDFVSPSYYSLSFSESMFSNDQDEYISYDFSPYTTTSMKDFYFQENLNYLELRIPALNSNLDPSINACGDFELAIMMADLDGATNYETRKYYPWSAAIGGPGWRSNNNNGCNYDDNFGRWSIKQLGGQNNEVSQYILWFVR